jgi:benzoyl-CoA reductase/2-hydroxyglutaryl-CoA dehydratase subunit BcrC/BadD/HgdB
MVSSQKKANKIGLLLRACRLLWRMNQSRDGARKSEAMYYQMLIDYYTRLLSAQDDGNFVVAHTDYFPAEILYAMDIVPMHTEVTSWMMALFAGDSADIISAGSELGLATEICSPRRGIAGAFATSALPRPDVILWSNMICDNASKCGGLLIQLNDCPGFFLDRPFGRTEDELRYFVSELEDMVRFLEERSGHRMDWDRLSEIVAAMDRQIALYREIAELRKAIPCPFHPQGFLELVSTDYLFAGRPEATEYLETLRDELADAVRAGKGAAAHERFRLMSLFTPPMYLLGFLEEVAQERGVVSVTEPLFTRWGEGHLNPSRPLESVARKSYMLPEAWLYGPLDEEALAGVANEAQEYKVDGAIYYAHIGCRHTCATIKLFKDVLGEVGVPMLTLDCDVVDPTVVSKDEVREKFERFLELLEAR